MKHDCEEVSTKHLENNSVFRFHRRRSIEVKKKQRTSKNASMQKTQIVKSLEPR